MNLIVLSLITLGAIGLVSAIVLYLIARKFKVEEDSRIDDVVEVLPGANCGGCGYPGCRGFATACVGGDSLEGKYCPVGGAPVMNKIGGILGMAVGEVEPKIAVVRCNGSCANRPKTNKFDGARSCAVVAQLYAGETGCGFGCLGCGDCTEVCDLDAIHMNAETGLPEVDAGKCGGCGSCARACPKHVIEIRPRGLKDRRVFVSCVSKDKGGVARKACSAACIGCGKCEKVCPFGAIKVENNLAYIDASLCRLCRKCVAECPTGAIHDVNFPTPAPKPQPKPQPKPVETAAPATPATTPVEVKVEEVKTGSAVEKNEARPQSSPKEQTAGPEKPVMRQSSENEEIVIEVKAEEETPVVERQAVVEEIVVAENEKMEGVNPDGETEQGEKSDDGKSGDVAVDVTVDVTEESGAEEIETEEHAASEEVAKSGDTLKKEVPGEIRIEDLISPEMRVKPRERREEKTEATVDAKPLTLGF